MKRRISLHIAFWFCFSILYTLVSMAFAPPSELEYSIHIRFLRYLFSEITLIPFKAFPFYLLFYILIPQYAKKSKILPMVAILFISTMICVLAIRLLTPEIVYFLYDEYPPYETLSIGRILYTFSEMIPALSLASAIKLVITWQRNIRDASRLQQEKLVAELNYLKAQTNPHFLFNTLNNLYGLARKNSDHTAQAILKLSHLFRYILDECKEAQVPIHKEVELIKSFVDLEKLRYDDRLKLISKYEIEDENIMLTPMLLLPLVENAFKHGASESAESSFIDIHLLANHDQINFTVKNSVSSDNKTNQNLGIGLQNIRRQLELIYPGSHQLDIVSNERFFEVQLSLVPGEASMISSIAFTKSTGSLPEFSSLKKQTK